MTVHIMTVFVVLTLPEYDRLITGLKLKIY